MVGNSVKSNILPVLELGGSDPHTLSHHVGPRARKTLSQTTIGSSVPRRFATCPISSRVGGNVF